METEGTVSAAYNPSGLDHRIEDSETPIPNKNSSAILSTHILNDSGLGNIYKILHEGDYEDASLMKDESVQGTGFVESQPGTVTQRVTVKYNEDSMPVSQQNDLETIFTANQSATIIIGNFSQHNFNQHRLHTDPEKVAQRSVLSRQSYEGQMKDSARTSQTFLAQEQSLVVTEAHEEIKVVEIDEEIKTEVKDNRNIQAYDLEEPMHTIDISEDAMTYGGGEDGAKQPMKGFHAVSLSGYDEDSCLEESLGYMKPNAAYDSQKVIKKRHTP